MDAARAQRQAALEEKKKRLEELKARRQQRATTTTSNVSSEEQAQTRVAASSNLDDYIDGLLQAPTSSGADDFAKADSALSSTTRENGDASAASGDVSVAASAAAQHPSAGGGATTGTKMSVENLAPVVKTETFEMATQTADDDFPLGDGEGDELENDQSQQEMARLEAREKELEEEAFRLKLQEESVGDEVKILSAEEVEQELSSKAFSSFLNATSKKVERVLGSDILADLLLDYNEEGDSSSKRGSAKMSDGSKFVSSRQIYECSKWTATRDVTDMDWSPLHRELMLCSYHMPSSTSNLSQSRGSAAVKVVSPDDTPSDSLTPRSGELLSDGLALVWNLAMPSRPEHIFTCGSPVTTTRFHPTESPLILGGCQSGQVVVWDIRAGRMPVQKSSLTTTSSGNSKGHTRPIGIMEIIEGGVSIETALHF
jgi:dynein intermediate chain